MILNLKNHWSHHVILQWEAKMLPYIVMNNHLIAVLTWKNMKKSNGMTFQSNG